MAHDALAFAPTESLNRSILDKGGTLTATYDYTVTPHTLTPTPLPAALPLFTAGLGAMGLLGWRWKARGATGRSVSE
jgi:hypothetical protein